MLAVQANLCYYRHPNSWELRRLWWVKEIQFLDSFGTFGIYNRKNQDDEKLLVTVRTREKSMAHNGSLYLQISRKRCTIDVNLTSTEESTFSWFLKLQLFWMNNLKQFTIEFGYCRVWKILPISEGVIHLRLRWITPSSICRILHILLSLIQ